MDPRDIQTARVLNPDHCKIEMVVDILSLHSVRLELLYLEDKLLNLVSMVSLCFAKACLL